MPTSTLYTWGQQWNQVHSGFQSFSGWIFWRVSAEVLRGWVLINTLYIKHEGNVPAYCAGSKGCTSTLGLYSHLSNWKYCLPSLSACGCERLSYKKKKSHSHGLGIQMLRYPGSSLKHFSTLCKYSFNAMLVNLFHYFESTAEEKTWKSKKPCTLLLHFVSLLLITFQSSGFHWVKLI